MGLKRRQVLITKVLLYPQELSLFEEGNALDSGVRSLMKMCLEVVVNGLQTKQQDSDQLHDILLNLVPETIAESLMSAYKAQLHIV